METKILRLYALTLAASFIITGMRELNKGPEKWNSCIRRKLSGDNILRLVWHSKDINFPVSTVNIIGGEADVSLA